MIYLDNAASSWPKPPSVVEAMEECIKEYAANPGRGSHAMALRAARTILAARTNLARLFNSENPNTIILQKNATEALNLAIKGILRPGDHVVTTTLEHNSVRRPLEYMRRTYGVEIDYVRVGPDMRLEATDVSDAIRDNTRMVVVSHASNVTGSIAPIEEIGPLCRARNVLFLVDASQTAGSLNLDVRQACIDLLAFTGHKSLYGPQGTGGLYVHPTLTLEPILHGGTGGYSELVDQPPDAPDRYESGTLNTVGFAGLNAGVDFIFSVGGPSAIFQHEAKLTNQAHKALSSVDGVTILGPPPGIERAPLLTFLIEGYDAAEIAFILDANYEIATRAGLHCSPLAHKSAATLDQGAVRLSFGYFNTVDDVDALVSAVTDIVKG